jgi:hypothetical protein
VLPSSSARDPAVLEAEDEEAKLANATTTTSSSSSSSSASSSSAATSIAAATSSSDERSTSGFSSSSSSWSTSGGDGPTTKSSGGAGGGFGSNDDRVTVEEVGSSSEEQQAAAQPLLMAMRWATGAAAAGVVSLGVMAGVGDGTLGLGIGGAAAARSEVLKTGYPSGASCGDFTAARTQVARDILTCNQDNWRENCLAHYSDSLVYTDGPGLTHIAGRVALTPLPGVSDWLCGLFSRVASRRGGPRGAASSEGTAYELPSPARGGRGGVPSSLLPAVII